MSRSSVEEPDGHSGVERVLERRRELRLRKQPARVPEHDHRRAEDRYRDEHHDAQAKVLNAKATPTIVDSGNSGGTTAYSHAASIAAHRRMRIRIVKPLPAPLLDGFDVRGLRIDHIYDVDSRMGRYLLIAGYAVAVEDYRNDSETENRQR